MGLRFAEPDLALIMAEKLGLVQGVSLIAVNSITVKKMNWVQRVSRIYICLKHIPT